MLVTAATYMRRSEAVFRAGGGAGADSGGDVFPGEAGPGAAVAALAERGGVGGEYGCGARGGGVLVLSGAGG